MSKKLFQHIASEPELKGACEKITAETLKVFKGADLFNGLTKNYVPKESDGDPLPPEKKELVTTVEKRLDWMRPFIEKMIDYEVTRDKTNTSAKADIRVGDVALAKDVPVTTLLSLEGRLKALRNVYDSMPTLDMSKRWELEAGTVDVFRHGPVLQYRTAKKTKVVVLHVPTKEHPAQVKDVVEDVMIGTFDTTYTSGAVMPGVKASLLGRIDRLIEAVKDARMRANEVQVEGVAIGEALFDFIHGKKD
jgi:hypothetical protein